MQSPDTLLEFPCDFVLKVVGLAAEDLEAVVLAIVRCHVGDDGLATVASRSSREGKYLSFTVTVRAESQLQLDALYTELSRHERILMAL